MIKILLCIVTEWHSNMQWYPFYTFIFYGLQHKYHNKYSKIRLSKTVQYAGATFMLFYFPGFTEAMQRSFLCNEEWHLEQQSMKLNLQQKLNCITWVVKLYFQTSNPEFVGNGISYFIENGFRYDHNCHALVDVYVWIAWRWLDKF